MRSRNNEVPVSIEQAVLCFTGVNFTTQTAYRDCTLPRFRLTEDSNKNKILLNAHMQVAIETVSESHGIKQPAE